MTFYERYANLCSERGLKPQEKKMTESFNISSGTISAWKAGAAPRTELLCKVADYFNVSIDYLLGRTDVREVATSSESKTSSPLKDMDFVLDLNGEQVVVEPRKDSSNDFSRLQPICASYKTFLCLDKKSNKIVSAPAELFDPKKNPEITQRFPVSSIEDWRKIIPIFDSSDHERHDIIGRQTEDEQFLIDIYRKLNAEGRARISQAVMNIYDEYAAEKPKEKANASAS